MVINYNSRVAMPRNFQSMGLWSIILEHFQYKNLFLDGLKVHCYSLFHKMVWPRNFSQTFHAQAFLVYGNLFEWSIVKDFLCYFDDGRNYILKEFEISKIASISK